MRSNVDQLRVLVHREEDLWAAQCLEVDLVGHGDSIERALESLMLTIMARIAIGVSQSVDPFAGVPPPPPTYLVEYERAVRVPSGTYDYDVRGRPPPRLEARRAVC